jgi:sarcosine oxidase, subunit gamma
MSDPIRKESPLAARLTHRSVTERAQGADVMMSERPFLGHINLRGDPSDAGFVDAVWGALGCGVPRLPNTFVDGGSTRVLWLGPDEWLIVTEEAQEAVLAANLRDSLGGRFCAVTEIGSGQTVITVAGGRARDVIAQGCSLDLHPRVFEAGRCAQTRLAKAGIVIAQTDAMPTFELIVRRSFADYLWSWLTDAAAEFE